MPTSLPTATRMVSVSMGGLLFVFVPIIALVVSTIVVSQGMPTSKGVAMVLQEAGQAVACAESQACGRFEKTSTVALAAK